MSCKHRSSPKHSRKYSHLGCHCGHSQVVSGIRVSGTSRPKSSTGPRGRRWPAYRIPRSRPGKRRATRSLDRIWQPPRFSRWPQSSLCSPGRHLARAVQVHHGRQPLCFALRAPARTPSAAQSGSVRASSTRSKPRISRTLKNSKTGGAALNSIRRSSFL